MRHGAELYSIPATGFVNRDWRPSNGVSDRYVRSASPERERSRASTAAATLSRRMLDVFLTVILPTFIVAAIGAGLQRWRTLDVGAIGAVVMSLLSPALVLNGLLTTDLPAAISLRVVAAAVLTWAPCSSCRSRCRLALCHPRSLQAATPWRQASPTQATWASPSRSCLRRRRPGCGRHHLRRARDAQLARRHLHRGPRSVARTRAAVLGTQGAHALRGACRPADPHVGMEHATGDRSADRDAG